MVGFFLMLAMAAVSAPAAGPANLVFNGSFNDKGDPLAGWKKVYDAPGESWYAGNEKLVSVLPQESGRHNVLRLNVANQGIADNQGVKVDSQPIPVKPGGRYHFSAWARSMGPHCRIMLEGYRWRPDTKPHDNPTLLELRKCYRATELYFTAVKGGGTSAVGREWTHATATIPEEKLGKLAQEKYDEIQFWVVHVIAVAGSAGEFFVSDIMLERSN